MFRAVDICKSFTQGTEKTIVLNKANFAIDQGEVAAIQGVSGSGKSTFLQICNLLQPMDSGKLEFAGQDLSKIKSGRQAEFRKFNTGFIFQQHNLLVDFTCLENVMLPLLIQGRSKSYAKAEASKTLDSVGLSDKLSAMPSMLSGGEQQRVAVARSIVHKPKIVFADEPTGNLDHDNALKVIELLVALAKNDNISVVIVTHDDNVAAKADKIYSLTDGKIREATRK